MLIPLALAASLFLAEGPADAPVAAQPAESAPADAPIPAGAPPEDYQFVAWCSGVLAGYLDLHDEVMPEVTRIESTWRRPGANLADDLKVYDVEQRQARTDLKQFHAALAAAEKASLSPLKEQGEAAEKRGRSVWIAGPDVTKARMAQEWMSWTLPARCSKAADGLEKRSKLLGASLQANAAPSAPQAPAPAPASEPAKN
jgi:hypothetical protein